MLRPLTLDAALAALYWRRTCPEALRTSHEITIEEQERWWRGLLDHPEHRYWEWVAAVAGLTYIDYINGHAEISLIVDPERQGKGVGSAVVAALLAEAQRMRLLAVVGEVYDCAAEGTRGFWAHQVSKHGGQSVKMPAPRKWWNGQAHGSTYFVLPVQASTSI